MAKRIAEEILCTGITDKKKEEHVIQLKASNKQRTLATAE